MPSISDLLSQIEKLAYSLLVWIILIPKTIIKIIIDPWWVRGYVTNEFSKSKESRFDDYVSPVILLLLCSFVPYIGFRLLPPFGLATVNGEEIQGDKAGIVGKTYTYAVESTYIDDSTNDYQVRWQFRDVSDKNVAPVVEDDQEKDPRKFYNKIDHIWKSSGDKQVYVELINTFGDVISSATLNINIVKDLEGKDSLNLDSQNTAVASDLSPAKLGGFIAEVQKNSYIGVIFLFPALFFALVAHGIKGKQISAESLKEVFYAQCYYFSPLGLFFYLCLFGFYYATNTQEGILYFFVAALLGIIFWFYDVEVKAIAEERGWTSSIAAFVVIGITVLVYSIVVILVVAPDLFRVASYYILAVGFVVLALYNLFGKKNIW